MIKPRPYQAEAIAKIEWAMKLDGNDLCVIPTGGGKSIVIAEVANTLDTHVLILQPSKEILEQNAKKLAQYVDPEDIGIYSASMGEKVIKKYTFATIGSIYKKAADFAHFRVVIIDECHLVNQKNTGSMFTKFLKEIGNPKVIGFTATPYRNVIGYHRLGNGDLEAKVTLKLLVRMKPFFWKRVIFNINNHELVEQGFLSPLKYIDSSIVDHTTLRLNKSESDFDMDSFEVQLTEREDRIVAGLEWAKDTHKSILVFCPSVRSAIKLAEITPNSAAVHAGTKPKEREAIINGFKDGSIKIVFNMGVLTTGFDHPELDCIILARPTRSIGLYYQMLGRGVRIAEGKTHCTVIDFTGTVKQLGEVESIKLIKREKWELETATGDWHNRPLYSYMIEKPKPTLLS